MRLKIFVVTYNNNWVLNDWFLRTLKKSFYPKDSVEIFIINNHSNFIISDEYKSIISNVLHNKLRLDSSTGYLARSWNQAILNGFKDLDNPDCDILVLCQNDNMFEKNWYDRTISIVEKYKYASIGTGDQCQIITPEAIKNIGLYDERFSCIVHQEADYFLRAAVFYKEFSSINDANHNRYHNVMDENLYIVEITNPGVNHSRQFHIVGEQYHSIYYRLFKKKWGIEPMDWTIQPNCLDNIEPKIESYILYPYFEDKIYKDQLLKQKYLI